MNLTLTNEQAQTILQLADAACKAYGLQCAKPAAEIQGLIDAAAAEEAAQTTQPQEVPSP